MADRLLAASMVCREAVRILSNMGVRGSDITIAGDNRKIGTLPGLRQVHVDWKFDPEERSMPFDDFSRDVLRPKLEALAREIGSAHVVAGLELPEGAGERAREKFEGIEVRFVSAVVVDDDLKSTERLISRIDVLCQDAV